MSFSLVLEHIQELEPVFSEVSKALVPGGYIYVGELHPFKQYIGSKARFITTNGEQVVECFTHHISDFVDSAARNGIHVSSINEYFDNDNRSNVPRILALLFKKI